ncbi:hypothetical protein K469DRAFT_577845 [Zopfia rhizophila CBS 207.26]|uniref:Uncharacterized protein n=1 Tax=Zopfia rhizophila CBS 207.26 TaxID=1314779 RepID=A0A6A6E3K8_9PEZI|nr:hypothetical protein K469DRAFT_577845 [Zopfia rhizophila CBS 207.26]
MDTSGSGALSDNAELAGNVASARAIPLPTDFASLYPFDIVKTPHNRRLLEHNQKLKEMFLDLVAYQNANPAHPNPLSRNEIDHEIEVEREIAKKKKRFRAQLAIVKTAFRDSVMKTREEKQQTAEAKKENDALVLQLHNLKYEEESLKKEISAARNYDHKYTKLPLIPVEEFLEQFPDCKDLSERELMSARIEHEYKDRVKLEECRQEKLKQKQLLIAEVKKRKEDLGKLDESVEKFIEAGIPIETALAKE